ncbi:MAG TPA: division/cell wall cluster transcriptional repressor MraZ [Polyangiaceae bacterium]|nr:MAG: cell division protein MraZ [Deltaproteobacteria bacterium ADurb.Bin207]HNS98756.1 division/cell wall cluster transcriptional repressor MraZ [Polyangiaceae bacterium]HNZ23642.1 division/cell wall cluster transcriptional repressor MraZ [Polyangiaceae bacterium]HOE47787.1 division/cell wall cluster transcriptional repressor MraZ [Polyangiaceae bacterium]HOH01412.1 division/cell wall cluster transcriptional repressor MraZ [Polyangiaceae bacterium]
MFRGQFTHSIDAKGRTSLPSRFRDTMGSGEPRLVLTPALFDPCIHVFPFEAWEAFEARVAEMPQFDPNVVRLRRLYVSAAVECDLDKQGRVLVPVHLREHAALQREVVWAGVGNKAELWASERWVDATKMTPENWDDLKKAMSEWRL